MRLWSQFKVGLIERGFYLALNIAIWNIKTTINNDLWVFLGWMLASRIQGVVLQNGHILI